MTIFEQMLSRYEIVTKADQRNAVHEVMQEIALAGLYRSGFFEKAAFYGGTCLRIIHNLARFSEDMDFSLLANDTGFDLDSYFPAMIEEFRAAGREVEITKKKKTNFGSVESAFLKDDTETYDLAFSTNKDIKIKIEVDVNPPLGFSTEQKLLLQPYSFWTQCYSLSDLYAGKLHALVFRSWKNRVKGRDWYDFEWYVRSGVELNFSHLQTRIAQFNGVEMSQEGFVVKLKERLAGTDIGMVKRDVSPFLRDTSPLKIWSNDYFLQLADLMKFTKQ